MKQFHDIEPCPDVQSTGNCPTGRCVLAGIRASLPGIMIEYESFIYLDVYRTGSTHIVSLLPKITDEKMMQTFRHAPLTKAHPTGLAGGKLVFATVRNPWDWYVSLWAYGTDGKSAVRRYLTQHLGANEVEAVYDKSQPERAFRDWLKLMHDPAVLQRVMSEYLPESGLAPILGLYTYRYLRVTTRFPRLLLRSPFIRSIDGARRHHRLLKSYSAVLRNEQLSEDLIALIEANRGRCRFADNAAETIMRMDKRPRNASGRDLPSHRDYYDDETRGLVAKRDRFFIDEFNYAF